MAGDVLLPTGFSQPYTLAAPVAANIVVPLVFNIPVTVPTGTPKLQLICRANASAGVVNLQVADAAVAPNVNPDTVTLTSEPATAVTFTNANTWIDNKVVLSAVPTANQILLATVTFFATSTLIVPSNWQITLLWE